MLELYNLDYSEDIAYYGNSIHTIVETFRKQALNRKAGRILRKMFEIGISREASNLHTVKDASLNVYSRAEKI